MRIQNFLTEYLGTPEHPVPFGGRQTDLKRLSEWLDDSQQPPRLLLATPAGRGKSALLVRWIKQVVERRDTVVIFFPVSIRFRTNLSSVIFPVLTTKLANLHGDDAPGSLNTAAEVWRGMMSDYLNRPLPNGRRLLLVLDGVDEAADWESGPDLFPFHLPTGTRVLISARYRAGDADASNWLRQLGWDPRGTARAMDLPPLTPNGLADVLNRMGVPLDRLGVRVDIVSELHRLSKGDPILVRLYVDDLWERGEAVSRLQPETLRDINPGLEGYFSRWWDDQRRLWKDKSPLWDKAVQELLNILACAMGPLSNEDVLRLVSESNTGLKDWTILEEALHSLDRFVIGDGSHHGYVFSHPGLGSYFFQRLGEAGRQEEESRFLAWGKETMKELNEGRILPERASPYIIQHYGCHLERAGCDVDEFVSLVSEGWQKAWYGLEGISYAGFVNDERRAWRTAEQTNVEMIAAGREAAYLGTEIRCALSLTSVNSLSATIPPALLVTLIETKTWTPIQIVAYARLISDPHRKIEAIRVVAPHLPEPQRGEILSEALALAREIEDNSLCVGTLGALTPHLPEPQRGEILSEALARAREIEDNLLRVGALSILISLLPEPQKGDILAEALALANGLKGNSLSTGNSAQSLRIVEALCALIPHLPDQQRKEAVGKALRLYKNVVGHDEFHTIRVLTTLGLYMPGSLRNKALGVARRTSDPHRKAHALGALITHLPEPQRGKILDEAIAVAKQIEDKWSRAEVLGALAPHLSKKQAREMVQAMVARGLGAKGAEEITSFVPYLPELQTKEGLHEVLREVFRIGDGEAVARVLSVLVAYMPEDRRSQAVAETLRVLQYIQDKERANLLQIKLIPYVSAPLPSERLEKIWSAAIDIDNIRDYVRACAILSPLLPNTLLEKAVERARELPHSTSLGAQESGHVGMYYAMGGAAEAARLKKLSPYVVLAPNLSKSFKAEVIIETLRSGDEWTLGDKGDFAFLSAFIFEAIIGKAMASKGIHSISIRVAMLSKIAPLLEQKPIREALFREHKGKDAVEELVESAPRILQDLQREGMSEIIDLSNEVYPCNESLDDWEALRELLLQELRTMESVRTEVRSVLAYWLPEVVSESLIEETLSTRVEEIERKRLGAIKEDPSYIESYTYMYEAHELVDLVPHLSGQKRREALAEVMKGARITGNRQRASLLVKVIPYLSCSQSETVIAKALSAAQAINDDGEREEILVNVAPYMAKMPAAKRYDLWRKLLVCLASRSRKSMCADLCALAPLIVEIGGKDAVAETFRAVQDVGRWWP